MIVSYLSIIEIDIEVTLKIDRKLRLLPSTTDLLGELVPNNLLNIDFRYWVFCQNERGLVDIKMCYKNIKC